jgi:hypothetical protein
MESLTYFKGNNHLRKLFSTIIPIDWYDGHAQVIGEVREIDKWFIANLVYFDVYTKKRIFVLVESNEKFMLEVNQNIQALKAEANPSKYDELVNKIEGFFNKYSGKVYLMLCNDIDDIDFEIKEISIEDLKYFRDVEAVLNQDTLSKNHWLLFFIKSP